MLAPRVVSAGLRILCRRPRNANLAPLKSRHSKMSSADAHIKLCNSLMAADRVWEATIDTLTDAVYIFAPYKRLKKLSRAGESLEHAARSFLSGRRCCDMLWGVEGTDCM